MNKKLLLFLVFLAGVSLLALRSESVLSAEQAREQLKTGALLVDVRTHEEFATKSLPGAVNIPVETIMTGITNCATNKSQIILLHCRSGRRSGIAETELRSLGYTNAFNIGSFEQAEKIVSEAKR